MPKFIDYHQQMPEISPEMAAQMRDMIESGSPNRFGVTALNIFSGSDGTGYCLSEGPDLESILKSHEATGVPLGAENVTEVQSIV